MAEVEIQKPPPPSWIDVKFVEKALESDDSESKVRVVAATVDYAVKDGSGYLSSIFRVLATIRRGEDTPCRELSLIVKCSQAEDSGNLTKMGKENQVFQKEALLLCEVLPEVHRELRAVESGRYAPLAAHCYLSGGQPVEFLVMDDLSADGFRLAEAGRPLDYQHCALALRAYARLHAASAKVLQQRPEFRARCTVLPPSDNQNKFLEDMTDKMFRAIAKQFRASPGYERYAEKYESLSKKITKDNLTYWESNNSKLNVVIHGDCWKNNFMFKYAEGKPTDVRIIDFQFSRIHSPAGDLLYFLYANASEEVHRLHMDALLSEYHSTLVGLLRRLGMEKEAEAYTIEEFQNDMEVTAPLCVLYSALSSLVYASEECGADLKDFFKDLSGSALEKAFKNPDIISYLKYLAPIFDKKGLL